MSYSTSSTALSVEAGRVRTIKDIRDYCTRTTSQTKVWNKKVYGKTYQLKKMEIKIADYTATGYEEWRKNIQNPANIIKNVCTDTNNENSILMRWRIGNIYLVLTAQAFATYTMRLGFVKDNKKEHYNFVCDDIIFESNGIANYPTLASVVLYGFVDENNELWLGFDLRSTSDTSQPFSFTYYNFTNLFGGIEFNETSDEYGSYSSAGGYGGGSFDDSSDAFGLPSLPSLGVSEVGFINVYNPSKGQLQGFADELFPNFEIPTPSTATGIEAVAENLANTFEVLGDFAESYVNSGLINYVIDCHIVPVAPVTNGTSNIKVGFKTFNYSPAKVTSDYVEFDCGSLEIAEYYQNFLDYEGTKAKLYLPFIGFVDIKPEWFQSGKLGVTYHFNIIDGSCIAFVIATSSKSNLKETVVATFGGNCCVHMPITGVNYSSMISGVVGGAVGIASNASNMIKTNRADKGTVMSNIEGATGIASNLADAVGAKPSIEQSNGYNAGMSFMCYRRPYLLIERPVASFSKDYPREQGLPLNVTKKLGSMVGFTTCTAPVVDNFHCLEEEKEMIKQALIEGTIF